MHNVISLYFNRSAMIHEFDQIKKRIKHTDFVKRGIYISNRVATILTFVGYSVTTFFGLTVLSCANILINNYKFSIAIKILV